MSVVFPNPASNSIEVKFSEAIDKSKDVNYKIYDIEGKERQNGLLLENQELNISHLSKGLHIIVLSQGNNNIEYLKFLKK